MYIPSRDHSPIKKRREGGGRKMVDGKGRKGEG